MKSNKIVLSIIDCVETQSIRSFDDEFDKKKLYNLVLEQSVTDAIAKNTLRIGETGTKRLEEIETRMVSNQAKVFLDPIKKHQRPTFLTSEKRRKLK